MKPKRSFELKESRFVELLERGFDGKKVLEIHNSLSRLYKVLGKKRIYLIP